MRGRRVPQIGRICMGMLMIDLTDLQEVETGEDAWLLGGEAAKGETVPTVQELADAAKTIPYEVLCAIGSMNTRKIG